VNCELKTSILILFIFFWSIGFGQQTNIKFGHLSLKDGLSQSEVICVIQDKKGLMWFGTQDGLNQYNGYEFRIFSHDILDSSSISSSFIHNFIEDENGNLWIATELGLNVYNKALHSFKKVTQNILSEKSKNNVWAVVELKDNIWAGTDSELLKVNKKTFTVEKINLNIITTAKLLKIRKLTFVDEANLLIATEGSGVIKYNIHTKKATQFTTDNSSLTSNVVWDFAGLTKNQVWIGTNSGINILNIKTDKISSHLKINQFINHAAVTKIYEDKSGIIWLGTETSGLYKVNSNENIDHYTYDATIYTSLSSNK
jgi:ligand-binding sensor domain-containing protein